MACRSIVYTRARLVPPAREWRPTIATGARGSVLALLAAGCMVVPRQAASASPPQPQVPESASTAASGGQDQAPGPPVEFRAKATDRQRFQVHIDFGRVFEAQG